MLFRRLENGISTEYAGRETAVYTTKAAYVDARYNPYFVVTKEDIDVLIPKVEQLRILRRGFVRNELRGVESGIYTTKNYFIR